MIATAQIINDLNNKTKTIQSLDYPIVKIKNPVAEVKLSDILPFRVRFTSIAIESLFGNPPAIPFQVIGYSNYIL
jgi:hypothetical protein